MDAVRLRRGSRERETSPDMAKVRMQEQQLQHQQQQQPIKKVKPIKKVQVVYYLSRNGQLEHPHYIEVTHLANQHLRLKDFMNRLTALRGKGMPSLYSWSCKRSYKNGYIWNDLSENDMIYPSDGAEYVLKGSELVEGCSERLQLLNVSNSRQVIHHQEPILNPKRKQMPPSLPRQALVEEFNPKFEYQEYEQVEEEQEVEEEGEESQEEYEDEEKTSYTSSTTPPHSRCSRGVSTDELEDHHQTHKNTTTGSTQHDSKSPPPSTYSMLPQKPHRNPTITPINTIGIINKTNNSNNSSKRFEDGDPVASESAPGRNSVLLQLISCGNLAAAAKAKSSTAPCPKQPMKVNSNNVAAVKKNESNNMQKVVVPPKVLHKNAVYQQQRSDHEEDKMIAYMSENPRFGNWQAEEKEYFSGSIVESMSHDNRVLQEPGLKRSNSYNEERGSKTTLEEVVKEEDMKEKAVKGKCIPRKKSSSSSKQTKRSD